MSHPGGSFYCLASCFLLRKQGQVLAGGGALGSSTDFFATNNSASDLTGYLKNFLKFCGMLEANLVGKNLETCFDHGHDNLFPFT